MRRTCGVVYYLVLAKLLSYIIVTHIKHAYVLHRINRHSMQVPGMTQQQRSVRTSAETLRQLPFAHES